MEFPDDRMWRSSNAIIGDFDRVSALVAHHLADVLSDPSMTAWHMLETALLETPYSVIRGRQAGQVTRTGYFQDELAVMCVRLIRFRHFL